MPLDFANLPTLTIPDDLWRETGDTSLRESQPEEGWTRLLSAIVIANSTMHLEAYAVKDVDGELKAINDSFDDEVEALYTLSGNSLSTVEIRGREYVLAAYPFS